MSYTRLEWCGDLLAALGNTSPTTEIVNFVLGWTDVETSAGGKSAAYNLLNTTENASGATNFNPIGVKNFTSYTQGVDTNALLIRHAQWYVALYEMLRTNDSNHYLGGSLSPMVSASLQIWVSGKPDGDPAYPHDVLLASGRGASDLFPGERFTKEQLLVQAQIHAASIQVGGIVNDAKDVSSKLAAISNDLGATMNHVTQLNNILKQLG